MENASHQQQVANEEIQRKTDEILNRLQFTRALGVDSYSAKKIEAQATRIQEINTGQEDLSGFEAGRIFFRTIIMYFWTFAHAAEASIRTAL